jgi:uncharacterized protein
MEEILSSIRRIIADEASDEEGEAAAGSRAEGHDADADAPARDAQDDVDEDVLELTEVVREEGEDIDLDRTVAQPLSFAPQRTATASREPAHSQPDLDQEEPDLDEQEDADPDDGAPGLQLQPKATAAQHAAHDPAQSPMAIQDDEMEQHQTGMSKNGLEPLVSDRAAGAAKGAFAKLSQAIQRTPPEFAIADDSGRTVEQFVEDMMRPMLRDWLDENLPTMVERIVQKEIQKIVRRAEEM